jgi:hypothetical protein
MKVVISQPMFFPWVGFFEQIKLCDAYVHYNDVQYSKGGFTNRVQVKSPEGIKWLTVPLKNLKLGQPIKDVEIDNTNDWRTSHKNLLTRCYQDSPYFNEMMELVNNLYTKDWQLLDELSLASLVAVNNYFGLLDDNNITYISNLNIQGKSSERVLATCKALHANIYITGHGASQYLDHQIFEQAAIRVEYMNYEKKQYPQHFGEFTPYVSILDLIANMGKDGINWISSSTIYWKDFMHE